MCLLQREETDLQVSAHVLIEERSGSSKAKQSTMSPRTSRGSVVEVGDIVISKDDGGLGRVPEVGHMNSRAAWVSKLMLNAKVEHELHSQKITNSRSSQVQAVATDDSFAVCAKA